MTRPGLNYETVKKTSLTLLSQGIAPSVQKIREVLGTGSNTTIAEHLKNWRDEYAKKAIHHLPANMPQELISVFEVLWQTAMEQAQNQLVEHKQAVDNKYEIALRMHQDAEKAVADLKQQMAENQTQLEYEIAEKQKLGVELAVVNERLEKQQSTITIQKQQYEDRLQRVYEEKDSIITQCCQLQNELKILQEKLALQAEQQQNLVAHQNALHEQSENRWLKLIDQARQETKDTNKKLNDLHYCYDKNNEELKTKLLNIQLSEHGSNIQLKTALEQINQLKQQNKILGTENIKARSTIMKLDKAQKLKNVDSLI
jgi:myosin heavy subunit